VLATSPDWRTQPYPSDFAATASGQLSTIMAARKRPSRNDAEPLRCFADMPFEDGRQWNPLGSRAAAGPTTCCYLDAPIWTTPLYTTAIAFDAMVSDWLGDMLGLPPMLLRNLRLFSSERVPGPASQRSPAHLSDSQRSPAHRSGCRPREWRVFWIRPGDVMRPLSPKLETAMHAGWLALLPAVREPMRGNDVETRTVEDAGYLEVAVEAGPTLIIRPFLTEARLVIFRKETSFRYVAPRSGNALLLTSAVVIDTRQILDLVYALGIGPDMVTVAQRTDNTVPKSERVRSIDHDLRAISSHIQRLEAIQWELRQQRKLLARDCAVTRPVTLIRGMGALPPFGVILEQRYTLNIREGAERSPSEGGLLWSTPDSLSPLDARTISALAGDFPSCVILPINVDAWIPRTKRGDEVRYQGGPAAWGQGLLDAFGPVFHDMPGILDGSTLRDLDPRSPYHSTTPLHQLTLYHGRIPEGDGPDGPSGATPSGAMALRVTPSEAKGSRYPLPEGSLARTMRACKFTAVIVSPPDALLQGLPKRPWTERFGKPLPSANPYRRDPMEDFEEA
jgi:hypothetical protein